MSLTRRQMTLLLARLDTRIQKAFLQAIYDARSFAKINELIAAVQTTDVDRIMSAIGMKDSTFAPMTESIRAAYVEGGAATLASDLPKRLAMNFDINNPRAETWLRKNSSQLITGNLIPEQRAAIQTMLQSGMIRGANPRTVALDIVGRIGPTGRRAGGVLGLTGQQAKYVANMADDLANLDTRYFSRKLRDRRFDSVVRKSIDEGKPLSQATRTKIIERYEDRMLKHRGDTIGRTEALRAVNEASDEALRQVVDEGLAPRNAVIRIWRHSFSANEREGHAMMSGQERGVDEYFLNPITGIPLKHPGDGPGSETINCRCYVEHQIDFVAVEKM